MPSAGVGGNIGLKGVSMYYIKGGAGQGIHYICYLYILPYGTGEPRAERACYPIVVRTNP